MLCITLPRIWGSNGNNYDHLRGFGKGCSEGAGGRGLPDGFGGFYGRVEVEVWAGVVGAAIWN